MQLNDLLIENIATLALAAYAIYSFKVTFTIVYIVTYPVQFCSRRFYETCLQNLNFHRPLFGLHVAG